MYMYIYSSAEFLEVLGHNLNKFNIDIQLLGVYIMAGISCSSNK